ncbi:MAG: response regulator [Patescibacteria group bacterium]|nr:response regulator [Patescibacteria group bacterium]
METVKKILLIEDDLYTRELFEEILKDAGFVVTVALDGELGFNKMLEGGYDLILLDIIMPIMDGLEVLTKLKSATPKQKNGPVVMLTNLSHDPIIKDALSKGANGYLIKSDLTPETLVKKVRGFLE